MRVLIACEYSGTTRDAFKAQGHDAWSCDLLPTETPGNHFQCDVREILNDDWDLMIAHPPCTYLSRVGNRHWNKPGRAEKRAEAMEFFMQMYNAPIRRVCVENPVGEPNSAFRKPDQIIHPYYFGDRYLKRTCLWLRGLPKLWHWKDDDLFGRQTVTEYPEPIYTSNEGALKQQNHHFTAAMHGWQIRSLSWSGIAQAMAEQWGCLA